jgi:predicted metal-dependent TIM-barrel fold hydrolase
MDSMFINAYTFNQDLSTWDVSGIETIISLGHAPFSTENYDNMLIAWSKLNLNQGVTLLAGVSTHSDVATFAYDILINQFKWRILEP